MRYLFLIFLMIANPALAADTDITGLWLAAEKHDIVVKIENCGSELCGHIVWLNDKKSQKSPDLCGQKVLWGFKKSDLGGYWENGIIYRPNKNQTYEGQINLVDPEHLNLRGYIGISLFGETHEFIKVDEQDYPACEILSAPAPESQDN